MSSSQEPEIPTSSSRDSRRQSLTRYVARVKTVLKRTKSRKQPDVAGPSLTEPAPATSSVSVPIATTAPIVSTPKEPVAAAAAAPPVESKGPAPAITASSIPQTSTSKQDAATTAPPPAETPKTSAAVTPTPSSPKPTRVPSVRSPTIATENIQAAQQKKALKPEARSAMQQDKARQLFAKYGLTIESDEWTFPAITPCARVEKPIRMRIHRHCHQCATAFGNSRVCPNPECGHARCKKCPRYPTKKPRTRSAAAPTKPLASDSQVANRRLLMGPGSSVVERRSKQRTATTASAAAPALTMPSRSGGQDLVHKPIKMRVRRNCHECSTQFVHGATTCASCGHTRCKICPRNPAKKNKFPDGYPGDAEPPEPVKMVERTVRRPRQKVRWKCHSCEGYFVDGVKTCGGCKHERCEECPRQPPKKTKPPPDAEVLRKVSEKLEQLRLSERYETAEPAPTGAATAATAS